MARRSGGVHLQLILNSESLIINECDEEGGAACTSSEVKSRVVDMCDESHA